MQELIDTEAAVMGLAPSQAVFWLNEPPLPLLELPGPAMQSVMHSLGPKGTLQLAWVCRDLCKHVSCVQSGLS